MTPRDEPQTNLALAEAIALVNAAYLSENNAAAMADFLETSIAAIEAGIERAHLAEPDDAPILTEALTIKVLAHQYQWHRWRPMSAHTNNNVGGFFKKSASVILPFRLPPNMMIKVRGNDRGRYLAPKHLHIAVNHHHCVTVPKWILPGKWSASAKVPDIANKQAWTIITLVCPKRGKMRLPDGSKQSSSLSVTDIQLVPAIVPQQRR